MEVKKSLSYEIAVTAILAAVVIVLQCVLGAVKIGTVSLTFVLVPIVIGGLCVNVRCGTILGFIFGVITLVMGIIGADGFTHILFTNSPVITALICIVKATAAGFTSALTFQMLRKKSEYAGVFVSAAVCPTVNTALFILGALTLSDVLLANFTDNVFYFLVIVCAGWNYLLELAINLLCAPMIYRVYQIVVKKDKESKFNKDDFMY